MAVFNLTINSKKYKVDVEPDTPLVWVIRDELQMKGTKFGCGMAQCGACTIHLDNQAIRSCQIPISSISKNSKITTIEGLATNNTLNKVQKAWVEFQVPQCGYCQSGQIMSAVALLNSNPKPSDEDIDVAMSGNLCRCGTYERIKKAIRKSSEV
jgi:isoquinoline 1-oxidoreductase subunit alpha